MDLVSTESPERKMERRLTLMRHHPELFPQRMSLSSSGS
jgi:hypothetical protein